MTVEFDLMISRGRKLPALIFALFVVAAIAAGGTFYHWHQTRHSKYAAALPFEIQYFSDFQAAENWAKV